MKPEVGIIDFLVDRRKAAQNHFAVKRMIPYGAYGSASCKLMRNSESADADAWKGN